MITSTSNAKVKRLVNLRKKRKARDTEKVFLTEGLRMFEEVPEDRLLEIYVTEHFYKKEKALVDAKHKKEWMPDGGADGYRDEFGVGYQDASGSVVCGDTGESGRSVA